MADDDVGTRTLGSYRLLAKLGEGGMGAVYVGEHATLGRRAAIKVLHPELSARSDVVARFFNEARAATMIADPGIVQVFDFGQSEEGVAYIVMEYLQGESVEARLRTKGRLPARIAARITRQVASTLAKAHAQGIVHRDLKPDNLLVPDAEVPGGERAKILDFGIAKLVGDAHGPRTHASAIMGTPAYMSPEQCRGAGAIDHRTDIYALGCVLFALVAGRPPFVADGAGELVMMHLAHQPPALKSVVAGIDERLANIVAACLAKDPSKRFQSMSDFAAALDGWLGVLTAGSAAVGDGAPLAHVSTPASVAATTLGGSAGTTSARATGGASHHWLVAAAGLAMAGALTVAGGVWMSGRDGETTAPTIAAASPRRFAIDAGAVDAPIAEPALAVVPDAAPPYDAAPLVDAAPSYDAAPPRTAPPRPPRRQVRVRSPSPSAVPCDVDNDGIADSRC